MKLSTNPFSGIGCHFVTSNATTPNLMTHSGYRIETIIHKLENPKQATELKGCSCRKHIKGFFRAIAHGRGGMIWQQHLLYDPHHPGGRRTLEWLVRETSGGRQLRTCTMLAVLILFVLTQWVALLAVTEASITDSALPAVVFIMGCSLKIVILLYFRPNCSLMVVSPGTKDA